MGERAWGPSSFPGTVLGQGLQSHSPTEPRLNTATPGAEPGSHGEAGLDWPFEQEGRHPAVSREGSQNSRACQRDTHFVHFYRARRQDVPLVHNVGMCTTEDRSCKGVMRSPGALPLSPARQVPLHSPLDAESQYNSIVTLQGLLALVCGTGIPHLTGNTSQQKVTGRQTEQLGTRAGCQQSHKRSEMRKQAACHLGTCLPGPRAEISLSRKGKFLQRLGLKLTTLHSSTQQPSPLPPFAAQANTTH